MAYICTDAGHGANDSGAAWDNVLEKNLNLIYTNDLNAELKKRGHTIYTTRTGDENVPSLATRCALVNAHHQKKVPEFDLIISVHCNVAAKKVNGVIKAVESRKGFYAIHSAESSKSTKLAKLIAQKCGSENIDLNHNGKLSTVELGRTLAWIHKTLPPAVLLELGFMTNPEELKLLKQDTYREKMVRSIADGIDAYLAG